MRNDGLGQEEGEGYFASVSDLMVGVLFVFLLMLTVFALNFRDDSDKLAGQKTETQKAEQKAKKSEQEAIQKAKEAQEEKQRADQMRSQNDILRRSIKQAATELKKEVQGREHARAVLLQRLAKRLDDAGVAFVLDQQSGVLHLSDEVPFAPGKSNLDNPRIQNTVKVLAEVLAGTLPCFAQGADQRHDCDEGGQSILEAVLVEGHTDKQSFSNETLEQSQRDNDRLSTDRALNVFAALRQEQPALDDLHNTADQPLFGFSGYGDRRPLADATSLAELDLKRNRRIDLRFVLSSRPSDELKRLLDDIDALQKADAP